MKSQYSLPILLLIFCAFAFTSGKSAPSANSGSVSKADSSAVPSAVHKIMVTSCFACHGEAGKSMALAHVKMAELGTYSPEKLASKAAAMCKQVTKGKMPPSGYLKEHPEAKLTPEQIATICNWSASLNKGK
jgi:mono/diheme cytochrome c family protein